MSKLPHFTRNYRLYAATDSPLSVARDLERHFAPYAVVKRIRDDNVLWYVLDVDDELLEQLKNKAAAEPKLTLASALDLHEWKARPPRILKVGESVGRAMAAPPAAPAPHVVVDRGGKAMAVHTGTALPEEEASVYPHLDGPADVGRDEVTEFALRLDPLAEEGLETLLTVTFPEGAETLDINAVVSSREFAPPAGESWSTTFVLDRALNAKPAQWVFKARALGDRPQYSLTVTFNAAGNALGAVSYTALRRGAAQPDMAPKQSGAALSVPAGSGAQVVICIAEQASDKANKYEINIYQGGKRAAAPLAWTMAGEQYFTMLEAATTASALTDLAFGLNVDLPPAFVAFLEHNDLQGAITLFMSDSRVAPFEVLQIKAAQNGPMLGVDRPVVRWLSDWAMPAARELKAAKIACIRPCYTGDDALPSAALEESELKSRFPEMPVARTLADIEQLLNATDVHLVHFAGHAQSDPPRFVLQDGVMNAIRFHPSRPLMKEAQPLFFVNGCRAGQARSGAPAILANFAKVLLRAGASGFIAPMIAINSPAALLAEKTFYDALATQTVAEAVRRVRELSGTCSEEQKATCSSYAAFVPAGLRVQLQD